MKAGTNIYFFDTYALVELNRGNPNYARFKGSKIIITLLNLMEFYSYLLKEISKEIAENKFKTYLDNCIDITPEIIKDAVEFRIRFIEKTKFKISYIDAIGYIIAKKLNIKFLTGDNAFKYLDNVEFVK